MPYLSPDGPNLLDKKVQIKGGELPKNIQQLRLGEENEDGISMEL